MSGLRKLRLETNLCWRQCPTGPCGIRRDDARNCPTVAGLTVSCAERGDHVLYFPSRVRRRLQLATISQSVFRSGTDHSFDSSGIAAGRYGGLLQFLDSCNRLNHVPIPRNAWWHGWLCAGAARSLSEVTASSSLNDEQARKALSRMAEFGRLAHEDSR